MSYMNCPRCGLSVTRLADQPTWKVCPRCEGRDGITVPIYGSPRAVPVAIAQSAPQPSSADPDGSPVEGPTFAWALAIDHRPTADGWMLAVAGELDLASAPALEHRLRELEDIGFERLLLDLRDVSFMDSTGLTVVIAAESRARRKSRRLEIITGDGQVKRLFEVTGADQRLALATVPTNTGQALERHNSAS